jgi:hypothetical protein
MSLPREWSLGAMAEFDAVRDAADEDYELQFVHTATLGHDIVGDLAATSSTSASPAPRAARATLRFLVAGLLTA